VVFYHGPRRWTAPTELTGLHTTPPVGGGYPANLCYRLFDLNHIRPEALRVRARAFAGMIAFKCVMRRLRRPEVKVLLAATSSAEIPRELRRLLWEYVLMYLPEEDTELVVTELEAMDYTIEGGGMRSVADVLRDRGREDGIGIGRAEQLARQLDRRFGLTDSERQVVLNCREVAKLDAAADAFADIDSTKESVLRHLK
jgi:hypothetical protein